MGEKERRKVCPEQTEEAKYNVKRRKGTVGVGRQKRWTRPRSSLLGSR